MTALEIKIKERELIQEINNDSTLLDAALQYVKMLKKTKLQPPCQYSIEELKCRLKEGRESIKNGAYKTQAEMRAKYIL